MSRRSVPSSLPSILKTSRALQKCKCRCRYDCHEPPAAHLEYLRVPPGGRGVPHPPDLVFSQATARLGGHASHAEGRWSDPSRDHRESTHNVSGPTGRNVVQRIQGRRDVIELVVVEVGIDVRGHRDRCTARPSRRTGYRFPGPGPPQIQVMASTALPKNDFHASGTGMYPLSAKPFCPAPMVLCRNAFTAAPTCGSRYFEQTIS